jgi:hypothetical protein
MLLPLWADGPEPLEPEPSSHPAPGEGGTAAAPTREASDDDEVPATGEATEDDVAVVEEYGTATGGDMLCASPATERSTGIGLLEELELDCCFLPFAPRPVLEPADDRDDELPPLEPNLSAFVLYTSSLLPYLGGPDSET